MQYDCDWKIAEGDARDEICKEVLRICADVLIIGTRGLSSLKKYVIGHEPLIMERLSCGQSPNYLCFMFLS